jgi:hypothetical protein
VWSSECIFKLTNKIWQNFRFWLLLLLVVVVVVVTLLAKRRKREHISGRHQLQTFSSDLINFNRLFQTQ